jgi:2-desacetyl-2-hydroxyethyl bacteriochlorophyllide A dehydrogenase
VRAAVLQSPRKVVVTEVPVPEPGRDEVLVKLSGAGICASELPVWEGREWFQYPRTAGEPGHEGWGRIEALGEGVENLSVGQRVALISQRAHAELDVARAEHVVVLPFGVSDDSAFPGEPLACAVNALRRAAVQPDERVAVVGCGFLGLLLIQLCSELTDDLLAVSRRQSSLRAALDAGATRALRLDDSAALERCEPFDVVFEVTGFQLPLDLAARLTRVRGRLIIAGYHQDGLRTVDMQLWNWRGLDVINAHEREPAVYADGLRGAVDAVLAGRLDPGPLLTHRFPLSELGEAYRISAERPDGFIKAIWCDD